MLCQAGVWSRGSGFGLESESLIWRRLRLRTLSVSSTLWCNFVAVYLTFVQFISLIKLCLYAIVHLLLEEFKNFSQVILKYTIIMSHNKSNSRSRSLTKKQGLRIPDVNFSFRSIKQKFSNDTHPVSEPFRVAIPTQFADNHRQYRRYTRAV